MRKLFYRLGVLMLVFTLVAAMTGTIHAADFPAEFNTKPENTASPNDAEIPDSDLIGGYNKTLKSMTFSNVTT